MKVAVVGLGPHGRRLVAAVRALPDLELVAVADRSEAALAWEGLPPGVARVRDASGAFGADLLCIATNGPSHAALAAAAMDAGVRRIMVEKPMGCSVAECDAMIEQARRTGTRLLVDQSRRYDPMYRWLTEQIASRAWGEPRAIFVQRPGIGLGLLGTHYFDLVRLLAGRDVQQVSAWIDPFLGPNPRGADFVDPGGTVVLDLGERLRAVVMQIEDGAGPMSVEIDLTGARVRIEEQLGRVEVLEKAGKSWNPAPTAFEGRPDMEALLRGLLADAAGDGPPVAAPEHGRASVEILAAAHLSHRRGHAPVALPLAPEDRSLWLPIT
jgi:predicted dehydrogenase